AVLNSRSMPRALMLCVMLIANIPAHSGVVQQVAARITFSDGAAEIVDDDRIFGATNQDIDRDITANIESLRDWGATATARRSGQISVVAGATFCRRCSLTAEVLAGTDEIVNRSSV